MKQLCIFLLSCLWLTPSLFAQTAQVQVIHNSPDPVVDIYANGNLLLDDFTFRTSTGFVSLPAGVNIDVAVAPSSSTSAAQAIATFPVNFVSGKNYIVTASGIVGNATRPFTLIADDNARTAASNPAKVDVSVLHGGPDAPAVDIEAVGLGNIITNLSYGEFTPYLSLDPGIYDLRIKVAGTNTVVNTWRADLTGAAGQAVRVSASGLLNSHPDFGLLATFGNGTSALLPLTPIFTKAQIIHNSPDPTVDIYANGTLLLNDFVFRTSTPFVDVPANTPVALGIAPANSTSVNDAIAFAFQTFETGKNYYLTATGIVGNTATPFAINVDNGARLIASDPTKVDVSVMHGSPDAPAVDIEAIGVGNIITGLSYNAYTAYLSLNPGTYDLAIKPAGTNTIVATFRADISSLAGQSVRITASGLLNGTPSFGLLATLANGTSFLLPQISNPGPITTKVQVIHNSPDPTVDVYANGTLLLDNFEFRTATPFVDLPTGVNIDLAIAPGNSTGVGQAIATFPVTLTAGKNYIVTASGIVGNAATPFTLIADDAARTQAADPTKVDVSVLHGSPDAPAVDIEAVGVGNIITNLAYGQFTGTLSLNPGVYDLAIKPAGTSNVVATFRADISGLAGRVVRISASGLLAGTPSFGLLATLADGTSFLLPVVPPAPITTKVQVIHNSPDPTVDVYANGTLLLDNFEFRTATPFVDLPTGVNIDLAIAPGNSTGVGQAIATFPVTLTAGKNYIVTASGIVGNAATPFTLIADDAARTQAADPTKVDVSVLHGSPDAPAVDIEAVGVGNIITNLAYGQFTGTLSLNPGVYDLAIKPAGTSNVVATFRADISGLAGRVVRISASGLLAGTPSFGLLATLADGTSFLLPVVPPAPITTKVQVIHNSPDPTVDVYANGTLLLDNFEFRTATPFVDLPTGVNIDVAIAPGNSTGVGQAIATFPVNLTAGKNYIVTASGIVGNAATPFTLIADDAARTQAADPTKVDVSVLHGSPDAPAVDIEAVGVGNIITNLAYGQFTGTLSLNPGVYDLAIKPAGTSTVVATFRADISGLAGRVVRISASGLLAGTPSFGLLATLADGTSFLLPVVPPAPITTKVQVIHNSPDPTVDVYANGTLLLDNFEFRTATPFVDLPTGVNIDVAIAPGNSTGVGQAIATFPVTLTAGKNYIVTASGIVGNATTPFTLIADDAVRTQSADPTKVDVSVMHGSPNAPAVDIEAVGVGNIITNLAYGQFTGTLSLNPGVYELAIKPTGTSTVVAKFSADISGLAGRVVRITASGLLGGSPGFGLLATLADGTSFLLPTLPLVTTTKVQVVHNSPDPTVDVYANGDLLLDNFVFRTATPFVDLPAGVNINVAVAPGNSTSVNDAIATFPVTFDISKTYIVTASGIVGNATTPFTLLVSDGAKVGAPAGKVDLSIQHGSPDAPAVDIEVQGLGIVASAVTYGNTTGYLSVNPAEYIINIKPAGSSAIVGTYRANISALAGQTVRISASGLLGGNPAFGLIATLESGQTILLEQVSSTNDLLNTVTKMEVFPNPATDLTLLNLELTETRDLSVRVRDLNGRTVLEQNLGSVSTGFTQVPLRVSELGAGQYFIEVLSNSGIRSAKLIIQR